jgi:hypothetical protein
MIKIADFAVKSSIRLIDTKAAVENKKARARSDPCLFSQRIL